MKAGGGTVEVVPMRRLDEDWEGPPRLVVTSERPGAFVRWPAEVARDGLYLLDLVAPRSRGFGVAELFVDGEAAALPRLLGGLPR
jgi:hypothetical protein